MRCGSDHHRPRIGHNRPGYDHGVGHTGRQKSAGETPAADAVRPKTTPVEPRTAESHTAKPESLGVCRLRRGHRASPHQSTGNAQNPATTTHSRHLHKTPGADNSPPHPCSYAATTRMIAGRRPEARVENSPTPFSAGYGTVFQPFSLVQPSRGFDRVCVASLYESWKRPTDGSPPPHGTHHASRSARCRSGPNLQ